MVSKPEQWVDDFHQAGANQITFHLEATNDALSLIKKIKSLGMRCGLAIKPKTPVESLFPYLEEVDMVLIMTVEPGFGGQKFMNDQMEKVSTLRKKMPNLDIQVDGGIAEDTIEIVAMNGANVVVSGSAIFKAKDTKKIIDDFRQTIQSNLK